jgi:hypothetical protein
MLRCWKCGADTGIVGRPARNDDCPACRIDLRSCRGCRFYAPNLANECSESKAEPPLNKETANFCDFFVAGEFKSGGGAQKNGQASNESARNALDKLFK